MSITVEVDPPDWEEQFKDMEKKFQGSEQKFENLVNNSGNEILRIEAVCVEYRSKIEQLEKAILMNFLKKNQGPPNYS